jgi:hypothetical protein
MRGMGVSMAANKVVALEAYDTGGTAAEATSQSCD